MYHGHRTRPPFFEGWYFKLINPDEQRRYAIIPGVSLGEQGQAFIQVLNGLHGTAAYRTLPLETFWASDVEFDVRIGDSHFRVGGISLDAKTQAGSLPGHLTFDDPKP
jgi:tocopherol cyclase